MGQGGKIKLSNRTSYNWRKIEHSQSQYQFDDWNFPEVISAHQDVWVYVEWHEGPVTNEGDTQGEVRYRLEGSSGLEFKIWATGRTGDIQQYRVQAVLINFATSQYPIGTVINLGWHHDGTVAFQLIGQEGHFTSLNTGEGAPPRNWMSNLNPNLPLSALSIPGTHDTCAREMGADLWGIVANWGQTQTTSLREQLDSGVRFLDIRCRHVSDVFMIHHGKFVLVDYDGHELSFGRDVRDVCLQFLRENPSETILMSVQHEKPSNDANNTRSFRDTFLGYVPLNDPHWLLGNQIPTLGEAQGKIVLLRRFEQDTKLDPLGIDLSDWPDNQVFDRNVSGVHYHVQDVYGTYVIASTKWNDYVKPKLSNASADANHSNLYINFSSGTGVVVTPRDIADSTNYNLREYLLGQGSNRYGIIPMDFPEFSFSPIDLMNNRFQPETPNTSLIVSVIASNMLSSPAPAFILTKPEIGGVYEVQLRLDQHQVLDVNGGTDHNGERLIVHANKAGTNQRFRLLDAGEGFFYLQPLHTQKVLGVASSGKASGTQVILWDKLSIDDQKWKIEHSELNTWILKPKHAPNMVMGVADANRHNGSSVQIFPYASNMALLTTWAQRWMLRRIS